MTEIPSGIGARLRYRASNAPVEVREQKRSGDDVDTRHNFISTRMLRGYRNCDAELSVVVFRDIPLTIPGNAGNAEK